MAQDKLQALIDKVSKDFDYLDFGKGFEDFLKSWLGKEPRIVSFKSSKQHHNVIVVVETSLNKYGVYRFFPIGIKWNVSNDLAEGSIEQVLDYLLGKLN